MVTDQQALGDLFDAEQVCFRCSLDGQKRLMLLRRQTHRQGGLLAKCEKFAQAVAKLGQRLVVGAGGRWSFAAMYVRR